MSHAAGFVEYSSFSEATDAGMACAWNPFGTLLAAGYQDGSLVIWDPRAHRVRYPHALQKGWIIAPIDTMTIRKLSGRVSDMAHRQDDKQEHGLLWVFDVQC